MRTLHVTDRASWRAWLEAHYRSEPDVWLVSYRKATGRASIPYGEAVSEALCFGWIDSTRRSLDDVRFAQRYSPRRAGSSYSQPNRERLRRLVDQGLVAPDGWAFFQSRTEPYQRIRLAFVAQARPRPDEYNKRLAHLIRMNAAGKEFGYGIDEFLVQGSGE